ncbi:hypothetical protein BESB_011710 [Besnoitia besnoiti]|uniref:Transmembrane protein n=1 Tax=Besnoitia besnoiti TaxID=94643 RepID=A0A2A9M3P3_BESBE|nr:hypothetical protein BESB_011710 [Besnoitia besnoiti]PFH32559.1 hypothetical protein BESB_011710 [Besnoitia besnoiti]
MRKDSRHGGGCAVLSRVSRAPVRGEECSLRRLGSPSVAFCVFASLSLFVACASGHNTPPSTPDGNNLVEDDSFMSSSDDEASLQSSYNGEEEIFSLAFAKREAGQPSFEDDDQNISSRRSGFLDGDTQYRMGTAQPEQTTTLQSTLPAFPSPAAPAQSERAAISSGSEPQLVPASGLSETNISPSAVGDLFEPSRKSSLAGGAAALSTAPPAAQASSAASRPTGRSSRGVSRSEGVAPPRSTDLLPRAGSATRSPAASIRKEPPFQVSGFTESETLDDYYTIVGRAAMGVVRTASLRGIEAPAAQPLAARIAATRPIPLRKGESGGTDVVMTETAPDPAAEADPLEAAASDAPQESTEERKSLHNSATRKAVTLRPRTPTWSSTIPRGEASVSHADPKTSRTFRRDGRMRQLQRKLTAAVIASLVMAALLLIIKSFNGEEQDRVAAASGSTGSQRSQP